MKRISFLSLRYLILIGLLSACSRPDFNLVSGDSVRLTDHQGQWIIINYWAEWCKPCLEEVPELNEFYAQVDGKLLFYSISYDKDSNEALAEQKKKYGMEYPIIATDPAPRINIPRPAALPANYLIAPDGKTYGPVLGPQDTESMVTMFEKHQQDWLSAR